MAELNYAKMVQIMCLVKVHFYCNISQLISCGKLYLGDWCYFLVVSTFLALTGRVSPVCFQPPEEIVIFITQKSFSQDENALIIHSTQCWWEGEWVSWVFRLHLGVI